MTADVLKALASRATNGFLPFVVDAVLFLLAFGRLRILKQCASGYYKISAFCVPWTDRLKS